MKTGGVIRAYKIGGEGGIRTLDTLLTHTHFPGVRFQPLTHFTIFATAHLITAQTIHYKNTIICHWPVSDRWFLKVCRFLTSTDF